MGGYTEIKLKDCSAKNINKHNKALRAMRVAKKYRFYSQKDTKLEYKAFVAGLGAFPENQFPREKINSYKDFRKYWSHDALGSFCPTFGILSLDCYFGRTSKRALRQLGKYVASIIDEIKTVDGSFITFMERGMTKKENKLFEQSGMEL